MISASQIAFYDNLVLDMSAITIFDMGKSFTNFGIDQSFHTSYPSAAIGSESSASVLIYWKQGRRVNEFTWAINSLDLVLGVIGGLSGIVWAVFAMILGGYEGFRYQNSLIGAVYPTAPKTRKVSPDETYGL